MSTNPTNPVPQRSTAIPPLPLVDDQLVDLADHPKIEAVWVPDPETRPANVYSLAGRHAGTILEFWVETADEYVNFRWEPADGEGLAWCRRDPTPKGEADTILVEETLEDYTPLREVTAK